MHIKIRENDLKHEIPLVKNMLPKESQLPALLEHFFIYNSLQNCVRFFMQAVTNILTLPVFQSPTLHARKVFRK